MRVHQLRGILTVVFFNKPQRPIIIRMFTNGSKDNDFLLALIYFFFLTNAQHFINMRTFFATYYATVYAPLQQILLTAERACVLGYSNYLPKSKRRKNRRRCRDVLHMLILGDDLYFRDHFRISKACFMSICGRIQSHGFYTDSERYSRKRHMVTVVHALAMLLIHIGHGCNFNITGVLCGFAKQTCRVHVKRMKDILLEHIIPCCISWPGEDEVKEIKKIFSFEVTYRILLDQLMAHTSPF
jgi:hypothetical protein